MTEKVRQEIDAFDLLMQDHREMESLLRTFEHLHRNGEQTATPDLGAYERSP